MRIEQFVTQIEEHWDKELKFSQRQKYLEKLQQFTFDQLEKIFERLIEEFTYLPRISQIYKTAFDDLKLYTKPKRPASALRMPVDHLATSRFTTLSRVSPMNAGGPFGSTSRFTENLSRMSPTSSPVLLLHSEAHQN